jgi:hypothetical protein
MAEAAVVVNWLEHHDLPAQVMDTMTLGGLDGLTGWTGVSARGFEVWVLWEDLVEQARGLLAEHKDFQATLLAHNVSRGPVSAECEECGRVSVFPGACRGKTEICPHCRSYLDVPGGTGDADAAGAVPESEPLETDVAVPVPKRQFAWRVLKKAIISVVVVCLLLLIFAQFVQFAVGVVSRFMTR